MRLDGVGFTGAGTYQTGVTAQSSKALFTNCYGIENTAQRGYASFVGGVTQTTCVLKDVYYPIQGTLVLSNSQLFSLTANNELQNDAGVSLVVTVRLQTDSGTAGTSSPSDTWEFGLVQNGNNTSFDPALPGSAVLVSGSILSAEAAGSRVRTSCFGVTTLAPGDRIRPYVANKSGAGRWYRAQSLTIGISILS